MLLVLARIAKRLIVKILATIVSDKNNGGVVKRCHSIYESFKASQNKHL